MPAGSSPDAHPPSTAEDRTTSFNCPLCCEEKPAVDLCFLSKCTHKSCRECCVKWIEKAEASGQQHLPGCPWCRVEMTEEETFYFLGRPFQPKSANEALNLASRVDELTLQWLRDQTVACPGCGVCIERIEGCDAMECLCGFRFCYRSGLPEGECTCCGRPVYYDNVLDREWGSEAAAPPRLASGGVVNFGRCIRVRREIAKGEPIRRKRAGALEERMEEVEDLDEPTAAARWLFGPQHGPSSKILNQIARREEIRDARRRRKTMQADNEARELDQMMKELQDLEHDPVDLRLSFGAPWLFGQSSLKILDQALRRDEVAEARNAEMENRLWTKICQRNKMMEELRELESDPVGLRLSFSAPWLFGRSSLKVLNQTVERDDVGNMRSQQAAYRDWLIGREVDKMTEEMKELDQPTSSASWLFCRSMESGFEVLERTSQRQIIRAAKARRLAARATEMEENPGLYGAKWLFGSAGWDWRELFGCTRGFYEHRRRGALSYQSISSYNADS